MQLNPRCRAYWCSAIRVASISQSFALIIVFAGFTAVAATGYSPASAPYLMWTITLLAAFYVLIYHLPTVLSAIGIRYRIGDIEILKNYAVISNKDSPPGSEYTAIVLAKLIPNKPAETKEEKEKLVDKVESLVYTLPTGFLYGFYKTEDIHAIKAVEKLRKRYSMLASKVNKSDRDRKELSDLEAEITRLGKSAYTSGILFMALYIHGSSMAEVSEKVRATEAQVIPRIANALNCRYRVLSGVEIAEFLRRLAIDRVYQWK